MSSNDHTGTPIYHSNDFNRADQRRDEQDHSTGYHAPAQYVDTGVHQLGGYPQQPVFSYASAPGFHYQPHHPSPRPGANTYPYQQPSAFAPYHLYSPQSQAYPRSYAPAQGPYQAPYTPSDSTYSPHPQYTHSPFLSVASPAQPAPHVSAPTPATIPTPTASPLTFSLPASGPQSVTPTVSYNPQLDLHPGPSIQPAAVPATVDPSAMHSSRRASSSRNSVKVEEGLYTSTGRPSRSARNNVRYNQDDDSEEEVLPTHHAPIETRHGRKSRAPHRYGEEAPDESEFENSMLTSPAIPEDNQPRRNTRAKGMNVKNFVAHQPQRDPDESVDGSPEPRGKTKAFPPRSNQLIQAMDEYNAQVNAEGDEYVEDQPVQPIRKIKLSQPRPQKQSRASDEEDYAPDDKEEEESGTATETDRAQSDMIQDDDDDDFIEDDDSNLGYGSRRSRPKPKQSRPSRSLPARRSTRSRARAARSMSEYSDAAPQKRELRERTKAIDYRLPPPDITFELEQQAQDIINGRGGSAGFGAGPGRKKASHFAGTLPWLVKTPAKPSMAMGDDDSDSDIELAGMKGVPSMPGVQAGTSGGQAAIGGAGAMRTDVPNFGRVNPKSNLADADPLGVDMNVTFENVGGLDNHINQLKEMVALPLLYPEIYQNFGVTPPRGVLFHGPPGTGKTLLARALAASCSTGNTKIAFFMRKGADVLSKWVGEAERQLRMLFEEARNAQPSIIFFDEIDGLAPVRSSKQDQIHASLVSTLLALMDGMDGRGQVIVIGATNRPDAVDPALRRPGRFDREFYFPLPNKEARKKIIGINTRKWSPGVSDEMLEQLAGLTKGYGGADLRSLCTEAALNAVQRRYPQIYSSTDRLLLDPSSIKVGAKDFMMSVKKIIPSSARSASSAATPLPPHLVPILYEPLGRLKSAVDKVLPKEKNKTALEEAQYEDEIGDDLNQHAMTHALDKMRTFRPRILVHGPVGMGQTYLGPAILHHLEGFHVQSLDLGALMGDSTNTIEAALVQRFVEAKRHQPSVLFIPSLLSWSLAMTDTARTAFRSLLDSVPASDSVLLLAMLDGPITDLPKDVRRWFGIGKEGRIELSPPDAHARSDYFASLIDTFRKPPTAFPDAVPRRKRVLEILPVAPPLPPREPTQEEKEREEKELLHTRNVLHWSFAGLWPDIPKKFDKYARAAQDGAKLAHQFWTAEIAKAEALQADIDARRASERDAETLPNGMEAAEQVAPDSNMSSSAPAIMASETFIPEPVVHPVPVPAGPPTVHDLFGADSPIAPPPSLPEPEPETIVAIHPTEPIATADLVDVEIPPQPTWTPHEINFDIIQSKLNSHKYFTPQDFRADIEKIVENAQHSQDQMLITKAQELATVIENHIKEFDHATWGPRFERYKMKMEEKKAKKAEKKRLERERAAVANGEAVDAGAPSALGASAPAAAEQEGNEGTLKRAREDGSEDAPDGKRQRNEMDIDEPAPVNSLTIPSVPSPKPLPPVTCPPFVCPEADLQELLHDLVDLTADLSVDLLEQLRAGAYDRLYRSRGQWDRREVIRETRGWMREFVKEVEEMEDSD